MASVQKRILSAAEARMTNKGRDMFALPPERIRYINECLDGLHPESKEFTPEVIAEANRLFEACC
jgi:hypothetical protein